MKYVTIHLSILTLGVKMNFFKSSINEIFNRDFFKKFFILIIGNFLIACAILFFIRPNALISGGLTGLAVLINQITNTNLSILILLLNFPTFLLSMFFLKKDFTFFSAISVLIISFIVSVLEKVFHGLALTHDPLLAAIFGGLINGVGGGLMFLFGTSTGGLDIIAAIFKKYFNIQLGNVLMAINLCIISLSGIYHGADKAMYTLILLFISYQVIDMIQMGVGRQKQIFIISDYHDEIAKEVHKKVHRGATFLKGQTAYLGKDVYLVYIICSSHQLVTVRNIVHEIDPKAFMAISDTSEIMGKGFKSINF